MDHGLPENFMSRRWLWRWTCLVVLLTLLAPIGILWCPGAPRWRNHAYRTLLYGQIAQRTAGCNASQEEAIDRLAEYVQTHLWTPGWAAPYDGTPADYLIRGIGWCDYQAKSYAVLLATLNIPARYAMLLEANGNSPHTVAEVRQGNRWGLYDVFFNLHFVDHRGEPLALEALSDHPSLLDLQPATITLRHRQPDLAQLIHGVYARVLPLTVPPRRSRPATERLTLFDRLLLLYARAGGPRFVAWYQDQYLGVPAARAISPAERLLLARHRHLAGRAEEARQDYLQCVREAAGSLEASEARFWLGLLEWELDDHPGAAARTLQALITEEPNSRWTPMAWYYMGRCAEALGQPAAARAWYAKSGTTGPVAWSRLVRLETTQH